LESDFIRRLLTAPGKYALSTKKTLSQLKKRLFTIKKLSSVNGKSVFVLRKSMLTVKKSMLTLEKSMVLVKKLTLSIEKSMVSIEKSMPTFTNHLKNMNSAKSPSAFLCRLASLRDMFGFPQRRQARKGKGKVFFGWFLVLP